MLDERLGDHECFFWKFLFAMMNVNIAKVLEKMALSKNCSERLMSNGQIGVYKTVPSIMKNNMIKVCATDVLVLRVYYYLFVAQ